MEPTRKHNQTRLRRRPWAIDMSFWKKTFRKFAISADSPITAIKSLLKAIFSHYLETAAFITNTMHKAIDQGTCTISLKPRDYAFNPQVHSGAADMWKSSRFASFIVLATAARKDGTRDVLKFTSKKLGVGLDFIRRTPTASLSSAIKHAKDLAERRGMTTFIGVSHNAHRSPSSNPGFSSMFWRMSR